MYPSKTDCLIIIVAVLFCIGGIYLISPDEVARITFLNPATQKSETRLFRLMKKSRAVIIDNRDTQAMTNETWVQKKGEDLNEALIQAMVFWLTNHLKNQEPGVTSKLRIWHRNKTVRLSLTKEKSFQVSDATVANLIAMLRNKRNSSFKEDGFSAKINLTSQ